MIRFACPACKKAYHVPDEFAGRQTKCAHCGQAMRVPGATSRPAATVQRQAPPPGRQIGPSGFQVRAIQSTLKIPGVGSIEGALPARCAYGDVLDLFSRHGRELGCPPSPYVSMSLCSYQASLARKAVGCLAGLGVMILIVGLLAFLLSGLGAPGGAGAAVEGTGIFGLVAVVAGMVIGAVVFFKITFRKGVKTASGVTLPVVEKHVLVHRSGALLTLVPLVANRREKPPSFSCDRVIEIDLARVGARAVPARFLGFKAENMFRGQVTLVPHGPPLHLDVIEAGLPAEVLRALNLESAAADATPPLGAAAPATKVMERAAFRFDCPAAWSVDEKRQGYDPDHMFFIDASPNAFIAFVIGDASEDPSVTLERMAAPHEKKIASYKKTACHRWGNYDGAGVVLRKKYEGNVYASVRIFAFTAGGRSFTVTEMMPDDETYLVGPGFRVIEASFRVKDALRMNL